jgi:hypothetical protein
LEPQQFCAEAGPAVTRMVVMASAAAQARIFELMIDSMLWAGQ